MHFSNKYQYTCYDPAGVLIATAAVIGVAVARLCKCSQRKGYEPGKHPLVTAVPPLRAPGSGGVTVSTFNILTKEFSGKSYGSYVPTRFRDWENHRLPLLFASLENLSTDIIAVQEASVLYFEEDISPFLDLHGYGLVAPFDKDVFKKGRDLGKTAILYRKSALTLTWKQYRSRTVLAAFVHNATQEPVYVINCHLEGNPVKAKERFQQIRSSLTAVTANWAQVNQKVRKCKPDTVADSSDTRKTRDTPFVIVTGDFNSHKEHAVYTLLKDGYLDPSFRDSWGADGGVVTDKDYSHPFELRDVYTGCKGRFGSFLGNSRRPVLIDFVFASSSFTVDAVRPPYNAEQLASALYTGTPNEWCVSDHFPLAASLGFPTEI